MKAIFAKQPNGLYCRFSDVVDSFTHVNLYKQNLNEQFPIKTQLGTMEEIILLLKTRENTKDEFYQMFLQMGYKGEEVRKIISRIEEEE